MTTLHYIIIAFLIFIVIAVTVDHLVNPRSSNVCSSCRGTGVVEHPSNDGPSEFFNCNECGGDGERAYKNVGGYYPKFKSSGRKGSGIIYKKYDDN